jgi:hypothetical protein
METRRMRSTFRACSAGALLLSLAAGGCSDFVVGCPDDLQFRTTPTTRTIRVGEAFTASAEARGCGGTKRLDDVWTWRAADSVVVRVDSLAGRITGRAPGMTFVTPTGRRYGSGVPVAVTVQ